METFDALQGIIHVMENNNALVTDVIQMPNGQLIKIALQARTWKVQVWPAGSVSGESKTFIVPVTGETNTIVDTIALLKRKQII